MSAPLLVNEVNELDLTGSVVSIGNFDGVHCGHRALLARMQELSQSKGLPGVAITFFPTSRMVFSNSGFLSSAAEKVRLISGYGPAAILQIPFSRDYARTGSEVFLAELASLKPAAVTVGSDFRFGRDRQGSLEDIKLITGQLEAFGLLMHQGAPISSSRIRELLQTGQLAEANSLLGASYLALGTVVRGDQRGRTIGFPTANLEVPEGKVLPAGVFAVTAELQGRSLQGMANVGPRPSFPEAPPALEVNLFDFEGDIYDEELAVSFVAKLRDQVKFGSLDELKAQLNQDERDARQALKEAG